MPLQWINYSLVAESHYIRGQKNSTFLTTLLHSWQQTKLPSVLVLLTVNVPRKALGVKSTCEVLQNDSNPALYPPPHVTDMGHFHT